MCGIAGILTRNPELDVGRALDAMRAALRHRGPDDEGCAEVALPDGYRLGLAHTRLAILDLSPGGHQPMHDVATGSWITYNGEVYNHQAIRRDLPGQAFRSTSDTETILAAWALQGSRALDALRGMFAFALYDGQRRQLWLVRDRLGIKPLYVRRVDATTWVFASELRALLASGLCPRRLNPAAVESYLAYGAVTAPWTLLDGVESLLPAESWRFDVPGNGRLEPERTIYWRPPFTARGERSPTREDALEQLRPVLREAVGLRMVSDVPVGVFLSGGIDSSSVVAALAGQGHRLRTFSVVFGERGYDESAHSRTIAQQFDTEHTELLLKPEQVLADFERAVGAYDQPSIDGVNTYFISEATRAAGVKVALSGLGGDELFAGYPYFRLLARLDGTWRRRLAGVAHHALRWLAPQSTRTRKLGAILAGDGSRLENYAVCREVLAADRRGCLFHRANGALPLPAAMQKALVPQAEPLDVVNAQSLFELALYMANMLLRDLDQMSMAHALEVREPLLDHLLVETVAALPGPLKLRPGRWSPTKGLLVDALPTRLPESVLRRTKMGFVFPWERWLRHELKGWVEAVLTDRPTLEAAGLDPAAVGQLWGEYQASVPGVRYTDILCLVHLLCWVRRHGLALGAGCGSAVDCSADAGIAAEEDCRKGNVPTAGALDETELKRGK
jgi:asparagine synthase (glutamine-hydrolysing)